MPKKTPAEPPSKKPAQKRNATSKKPQGARVRFVVAGPGAVGKTHLVTVLLIPYLQANGYDIELFDDSASSEQAGVAQRYARKGQRMHASQPLVEIYVTNKAVTW